MAETHKITIQNPCGTRTTLGRLNNKAGQGEEHVVVRVNVPANPLTLLRVISDGWALPGTMNKVLGLALIAKSGDGPEVGLTCTITNVW